MPDRGPERLTRPDLVVLGAFVLALVVALVALPLHGLAQVGAALGIGVVAAVLTGLVAYRGMRDSG